MSENKPKIYGFCPAGCKWETVHKNDFDKSATYITEQPVSEGVWLLEPNKLYKIFTDKTGGAYNCVLDFVVGDDYVSIPYTEFDDYRDYIFVEILLVSNDAKALIYEINGNRYYIDLYDLSGDLTTGMLRVSNAEKVYSYNADANIEAVGILDITPDGQDESGGNKYKITLTNGNTYDFVAPKGDAGSNYDIRVNHDTVTGETTFSSVVDYAKLRSSRGLNTYVTLTFDNGDYRYLLLPFAGCTVSYNHGESDETYYTLLYTDGTHKVVISTCDDGCRNSVTYSEVS